MKHPLHSCNQHIVVISINSRKGSHTQSDHTGSDIPTPKQIFAQKQCKQNPTCCQCNHSRTRLRCKNAQEQSCNENGISHLMPPFSCNDKQCDQQRDRQYTIKTYIIRIVQRHIGPSFTKLKRHMTDQIGIGDKQLLKCPTRNRIHAECLTHSKRCQNNNTGHKPRKQPFDCTLLLQMNIRIYCQQYIA